MMKTIGSEPPEPMSKKSTGIFVPFDVGNPYQRLLKEGLSRHGVDIQGSKSLKEAVRAHRAGESFEVVHLHWLPNYGGRFLDTARSRLFLRRLRYLQSKGCRVVWTVHNLKHHEPSSETLGNWLASQTANLADAVIVHSPTAAKLAVREFRIERHEKIKVIPHGNYIGAYENDISRSKAREFLGITNDDQFVFLFLGQIRPYKGVPKLIEAFRNCKNNEQSTLIIAGKPIDEPLERRIRMASDEAENIILNLSFVQDSQIQNYMNACDIVVFPYQQILTSGAVILAMSFGKACIAPRMGCISDCLNESGGWLYSPENGAGGLASVLSDAMKQKDRISEMGNKNFERALEWGWSFVAEETRNAYYSG